MKKNLLIIGIILSSCVSAQITTSFSIGGISLPSSSTYSSSLILSSDKSCLHLYNGVLVFQSKTSGSTLFDLDCNTALSNFSQMFTVAPNPSFGFTRLFFNNSSIVMGKTLSVFIYDFNGRVVNQFSSTIDELKSGLMIKTDLLSSGAYLIKVFYNVNNSGVIRVMSSEIKLINILN